MADLPLIVDFRKRVGVTTDEVDYLLSDARAFILTYTGRTEEQWIWVFDSALLEIAVITFNRVGVEGIRSRDEGGVSTTFNSYYSAHDFPQSVLDLLNRFRLIKVVM